LAGVLDVTSMVVTPLDFETASVYSSPPPWVPSSVVENLKG